MVNHQGSVNQT